MSKSKKKKPVNKPQVSEKKESRDKQSNKKSKKKQIEYMITSFDRNMAIRI